MTSAQSDEQKAEGRTPALLKEFFRDRSRRWPLLITGLLLLAESAVQAASPLALRHAVNSVGVHDLTAAGIASIVFAVSLGMARALRGGLSYTYTKIVLAFRSDVSQRIYRHVLSLPHSFHLKRSVGEVERTIAEGLNGLQSAQSGLAFGVLPIVLQSFAVIGVLIALNRTTIIILLAVFGVVYGLISYRGMVKQMTILQKATEADVNFSGIAADTLLNYETVRLFAGENLIQNRIHAALAQSRKSWSAFFFSRTMTEVLVAALFTFVLASALLLVVHEVGAGSMTPGDFVLISAYVLQLIAPIEALGSTSRDVTQALASIRRLEALLKEAPEFSPGSAPVPGDGPLELRMNDISFGYGDQPVLCGVDLHVPSGRTVAIVGASGSGKTTLTRILTGLYRPDSGSFTINDQPVHTLDLRSLRAAVAVVPQDTILLNDTLRNNIAIGCPEAAEDVIEAAAAQAGLGPVIRSLPQGWNTMVGERGLRLSGGERQRVAIARAILKQPRLFVFDEATASLDTTTERFIQENLDRVSQGLTTLIIAHRLSTIQNADEIAVLSQGRIVERGRHHALMRADGHYAQMWRAQQLLTEEA